jgi:hypothetical protein
MPFTGTLDPPPAAGGSPPGFVPFTGTLDPIDPNTGAPLPQTWGQWANDVWQNTRTSAVKGLATLPAIPNTIGNLYDYETAREKVPQPVSQVVPGRGVVPASATFNMPPSPPAPVQPSWLSRTMPTADQLARSHLGESYYEPQTPAGRIYSDVVQNAVAGAIGGPEGMAARTIAGGAAGLASGALNEYAPDAPTWLKVGVPLVAGLAAGKVAAPAITTPVTEAYERLGMKPLRADVTGGPITQFVTANVSKLPGAGGLRKQQQSNLNTFANKIEDTAADLGQSDTPQKAGAALQLDGENWLKNFQQDQRAAWNDVDMHVPPSTPVPVTNYASTLTGVRNQMPAAPATATVLQSGLSRDLLNSLIQDTRGGPLDWQSVRGIRTRIGEMLNDKNLIGDTSYGDLRRIYGSLSTDLDQAVQPLGPGAINAVDRANTLTREGHDFIDNTLSHIVGNRNNPIAPEQAYNAAMSGANAGGTTLQSIRDQLPQGADELAAARLRQMSLATPGARAGQGVQTSPDTFLTNLNRMSTEARTALYGSNPTLADLETVAGSMRGIRAYTNWSGTAPTSHLLDLLGGGAGWEVARAAHERGDSGPAAAAKGLGTFASSFMPGFVGSRIARTVPRVPGYSPSVVPFGAIPGLLGTQPPQQP